MAIILSGREEREIDGGRGGDEIEEGRGNNWRINGGIGYLDRVWRVVCWVGEVCRGRDLHGYNTS